MALPPGLPDRLVLFDGVCNLCNASVRFILRRDPSGKFHFAPLRSTVGKAVLEAAQLPTAHHDSFVYVRQGRILERSTAALWMARDLGGAWSLLYAFIIVPRPLRDGVYDLVARYRYRWFGKRDACMVPTPEQRARFLMEDTVPRGTSPDPDRVR